jgi:DNA repair exonuclease SbcCD ATPase subunit
MAKRTTMYEYINSVRIYQLQIEIHQARQQPNQSITELLNHIEKKREEIRMYRPQTTNLEELQKREEKDKTFQFLASLVSSYEVLRSQIHLSEDLPPFDKIANMIQREESRQVVMNTQTPKTEEAKTFAVYRIFNANPRPAVRGDQGIRCEYCKKEGHEKEECRCLHPHL